MEVMIPASKVGLIIGRLSIGLESRCLATVCNVTHMSWLIFQEKEVKLLKICR